MAVELREVTIDDAPALRCLTEQLGYPADDEVIELRLFRILFEPGGAVFVAEDDGHVVGWIHVCRSVTLESDPKAEIRGLVVAENRRGEGIGGKLVALAENWAVGKELATVRVRSRLERERAQEFYHKLGYATVKDQRTFEKKLPIGVH